MSRPISPPRSTLPRDGALFREQQDGLLIYISSSAARLRSIGCRLPGDEGRPGGSGQRHDGRGRALGIRDNGDLSRAHDTPMVLKRPTPTPPEVLARALQPEDVAAACMFVLQLPARAHVPELVLYPSQP